MVAPDSIKVAGMEGAMYLTSVVTRSALGFERTGIAGGCISAVLNLLRLILPTEWTHGSTLRAQIHILRRVVDELGGSEVGGHVFPIRQGNVGVDASVFDGFDVLDRSIGRVTGYLTRL